MQIMKRARGLWLCSIILIGATVPACNLMSTGYVIYDQRGTRIGIESDPTVSRAEHPARNDHPANMTPKEIESLLHAIQVSGWSGTLAGVFAPPRPVPLFTPAELSTIAHPVAAAFHVAQPTERIAFSLPKPDVPYSEDRTEGFLFLRGRYLHVVVTDHSSVIRADTGGGELKDIRDTKGMKLWVAGPAQAAMVPDLEEPRWAPFETVHVSLNVQEVIAQQERTAPLRTSRELMQAPNASSPSGSTSGEAGVSRQDLQLQIRELTTSNVELRGRLAEQQKRVEQLTEQMEQLRHQLDLARSKKPPSRKSLVP